MEDIASSGMGSKKMVNIYILEVLKKYSDENHHLRQQDIIDYIKKDFGLDVERKAVSVNISRLNEFGYTINKDNGYYLSEREFDDSELRLLIDSVLFSKNIPTSQANDLIKKLESLSSQYFHSRVKHVASLSHMEHTGNKQFFYSIELLDEAIEKQCQVQFYYDKYGEDKKLHHRKKDKTLFNPYQMVASNGRYYVIGNVDKYEDASYYRLDKISEMQVLSTPVKSPSKVVGLENLLNLSKHMAEHIYMFSGKSTRVRFKINKSRLDDVIDWFGKEFKIIDKSEEYYTILVDVNVRAMYYWALQYGQYAEVLSPLELREDLKNTIKDMYNRYTCENDSLIQDEDISLEDDE